MPLPEVVGSVKLPPEQIGATCAKVGVTLGLTVTVIVAVVAHCPERGSEGISGCSCGIYRRRPSPRDAVARSGWQRKTASRTNRSDLSKTWRHIWIDHTVIVAVVAHCPELGVKV
jgi:hypothetical protein